MKRLSTKNNCELVIVPHNLTNKLQSLDISIKQAAKKLISNNFNILCANRVSKQLSNEITPGDVKVSLKMRELKPLHAKWIVDRHVQLSQETKQFHNQRLWCCRDSWGNQICKWCLHKSRNSFQQTEIATFVIAFVFVDCFEYSQDLQINMIFWSLLSIYSSHILIGGNPVLEVKFVG